MNSVFEGDDVGRLMLAKLRKYERFLLHVSTALLATFIFYSIIFAANLLRIPFYLGYEKYVTNIMILTPEADIFLWVFSIVAYSTSMIVMQNVKAGFRGLKGISLPLYGSVLIILLYFLCFGFGTLGITAMIVSGLSFAAFSVFINDLSFISTFFCGMLILLGLEAVSFTRWIYNLFSPSLVFSNENWSIAFAEAQISSIFYPILPNMLLFFSFSWILGLTVKFPRTNSRPIYPKSFRISLIVTLTSILTALFIGYYNFAISGVFNPAFPGEDVPNYINWLNNMMSRGSIEALMYASKDDRFLYLILQYFCSFFSSLSLPALVTFVMPEVLTLIFMFSTFMLVKIGRNRFHGATAMLVTAFSFQVTVGLYAGFYANWFALALVYVFYGLLVMVLRGRANPSLLLLTWSTSVAVLYVHPWTWILMVLMVPTAYMFVTFLLVLIRKMSFRGCAWEAKFTASLLAINIVMFYLKSFLGFGSGARLVGGYVNVEQFNPSLFNVFRLKEFLDWTFRLYCGGFYGYVPMIIFAIIGVFSFLDYEDRYNRLMLSWLLVMSSMVFVEFPWHGRFLYDTPFNIFVASGILYFAELLSNLAKKKEPRRIDKSIFWVFYTLSILLLLNYAVRCVMIKQFGPSGLTTP